MPIAALPAYLGNDFPHASPGLRFGLLLPIWTCRQDQEEQVRKRAKARSREGQEVADMLQQQGMDATIRQLQQRGRNAIPGLWNKNDCAAKRAWDEIKILRNDDQQCMKALADRQSVLAQTVPAESLLRLEAIAQAPFTTGLGNEHPLENGFAFLNPYGLPYLPGSGVKGVLRQAARELASGDWGEKHGRSVEKTFALHAGKECIPLSVLDALFGLESKDGDKAHVRGALTFWDVIPQIAPQDPKKPNQISLMVEIMTPHQSHYYQDKRERKAGDSTTPHDSGQPNPIIFLTVPPRSGFTFHVVCDLVHLRRIAPKLAENNQWKTLLTAAFEHAFRWLGFGAKTAVGYGAMAMQDKRQVRSPTMAKAPSGQPATPRATPPAAPKTETVWHAAKLTYNPGTGEIMAVFEGKSTAGVRGERAKEMLAGLGDRAEQLKKKKELKNIAVRVRMQGNMVELLGLAEQP